MLQDCAQRLVVTLTVQNGQNATESFEVYHVTSATDAQGNVYDLLDTLDFTLVKSVIELHYPLVYVRQFNARPAEISLMQSPSGRVRRACRNVGGRLTFTVLHPRALIS